jgi:hypothetical protein
MNIAAEILPFIGCLTSTAFHVRDPEDFEADARVLAIRSALDLMVGQFPEDDAPCYCLVRDLPPSKPLCIKRQPGEVVINEGGNWDPKFLDRDGWLTALQIHVREDDAIVITEHSNPNAPSSELTWVITSDRVRCAERPLICQ